MCAVELVSCVMAQLAAILDLIVVFFWVLLFGARQVWLDWFWLKWFWGFVMGFLWQLALVLALGFLRFPKSRP